MPLNRMTATLAFVASVAAACVSPAGLPEEPTDVPTETVVAGLAGPAPDASPSDDAGATGATPTSSAPVSGTASGEVDAAADPSPVPSPSELAATVEVVQPDYVVDAGTELDEDAIASVESLPGLAHVARVGRAEVMLSGPKADLDETMMAVDAAAFRPLTPEVTAQSVGVWQRLEAGDVVLRHDVANELGIELGGNLLLATDAGSRVVRVGAFAANGTPPVAAVLVPWSVGRELGVQRPNGFVLAVEDDQVEDAPDAISGVLDGAEVERRRPPQQQTASTGGSTQLEPFDYTDFGDGTISIDPAWVARHIRTVEIPGIATTRCHELMIPQLLAALDEIRAMGLYDHFKPEQFGGCWVPRRIDWDPSKPLSNHAWGIAIDFNTHDNWLGEQPQMDRRIVEVFEKWGFEWGGHWRRPDGMHFELDRIVQPSGG